MFYIIFLKKFHFYNFLVQIMARKHTVTALDPDFEETVLRWYNDSNEFDSDENESDFEDNVENDNEEAEFPAQKKRHNQVHQEVRSWEEKMDMCGFFFSI